jgi:hypothetical protein
MSDSTFHPRPHAEVLRSVFDLTGRGISKPLAESILALEFPEKDAARIHELNAKANEGTLNEAEGAELEVYINVGDLLAYWQSKARQSLHSAS